MVSLTCLPKKHEFKVFIFLLDKRLKWLKITHFLFGKLQTSRGRPNLGNDMNKVTNLKSMGFTWKIANLLGLFSWGCFMWHWLLWYVAFDPHIFSIVHFVVDRVAELVLFISVAETDDSPAPTQRSSLLSPLLPPPLVLGTILILVQQKIADFHPSTLLPCSPNL